MLSSAVHTSQSQPCSQHAARPSPCSPPPTQRRAASRRSPGPAPTSACRRRAAPAAPAARRAAIAPPAPAAPPQPCPAAQGTAHKRQEGGSGGPKREATASCGIGRQPNGVAGQQSRARVAGHKMDGAPCMTPRHCSAPCSGQLPMPAGGAHLAQRHHRHVLGVVEHRQRQRDALRGRLGRVADRQHPALCSWRGGGGAARGKCRGFAAAAAGVRAGAQASRQHNDRPAASVAAWAAGAAPARRHPQATLPMQCMPSSHPQAAAAAKQPHAPVAAVSRRLGNSEATWPSGPTPSSTQSSTGHASAVRGSTAVGSSSS